MTAESVPMRKPFATLRNDDLMARTYLYLQLKTMDAWVTWVDRGKSKGIFIRKPFHPQRQLKSKE
jgi:hypothetical protein